ncbi:MAG TPA: DDE transposase [Nitrospinaceae bacterium]|nr:DDE transposase [Nitrospinaceae bacterium]
MPSLGKKKCFLDVKTQQVECKNCNRKYWPQLPFVDGRQHMTRSFTRFAIDLLSFGTIQDTARFLGIGWDTIKRIHKKDLQSKYSKVSLEEVEYVSIDEFSIKKRHKYMTVVSDIRSGRIIYAVVGRKEKHLKKFFRRLKKKLLN